MDGKGCTFILSTMGNRWHAKSVPWDNAPYMFAFILWILSAFFD